MLDVFKSDPFQIVPLSLALRDLKFLPGRIRELGLFNEDAVASRTVAIERIGQTLKLIPPTPYGAPGVTMDKEKRTLQDVSIPKFEINDGVMAEEVQGVRAFGSETALETVMGKVAGRGVTARQSFEVTHEYSRMGAIKGTVTYADGTTLDLANLFGVSLIAERDFDLDNANPDEGILRKTCADVTRQIANELDGIPFSGVHAFCGDNFFDDLLRHAEVRATYDGWSEAKILREGYISPTGKIYSAFEFGGIVWENYRGSVGGTGFIGTDKCHIFPVGVPNLFQTWFAPADYNETVNTLGQPIYAKMWEMPNGKGYHLDFQSNAVHICTRPRVLLRGKRT